MAPDPFARAATVGGAPRPPVTLQLTWTISRHARRLFGVAVVSLALAVVTRRPELVAVATPALVLLCARRDGRPGTVQVWLQPSAGGAYEGEQVAVEVTVTGQGEHQVETALHLFDGARAVRGGDRSASNPAVLSFELEHWGRRRPGTLEVTLWDRYRLFEAHRFVPLPELSGYPQPALYRRAVVLGHLGNRSGEHPARSHGEGSEFIGVRQYVAGDRQRSINWAATTRRGRLQVNTFAAERSQDVVILVDATSELGKPGSTTLDHAVRGALGVARTYLGAHDRVGVVFFGEQLTWLPPGLGQRQFFRVMGVALAGRAGWSSGLEISRLPRVALPPGAAVVAFSPLLDVRFVETLRDLRQRNFAVTVVDVLNVEPRRARNGVDRLAERIWRLERQALKFSLGELEITVVHWDGQEVLSLPAQRQARWAASRR